MTACARVAPRYPGRIGGDTTTGPATGFDSRRGFWFRPLGGAPCWGKAGDRVRLPAEPLVGSLAYKPRRPFAARVKWQAILRHSAPKCDHIGQLHRDYGTTSTTSVRGFVEAGSELRCKAAHWRGGGKGPERGRGATVELPPYPPTFHHRGSDTVLSVEVATPDELASVLEVLPRLKLKDIARVRVSCEDEIRRRVAALARKRGMDIESAIIGAQPVAELEGVPGCVVRLAECDDEDDDEGELLEPTDIYEPHELRLVDIELDTE